HGPGRAVGVVEDQQLGAAADVGRDGGQVGVEAVLGPQGQVVDLTAVVAGVGAGHGVAGHGHEGDVAGVDEGGREHGQGRLGTDGVVDLGGRVELDAEGPLHEGGGGLLEGGDAVVGVAAVLRLVHLALEHVADEGG